MSLESHLELNKVLASSDAGKSLQNTYRWLQFRTDESNETWMKVMGATGRVDTHMHWFSHLALKFLKVEQEKLFPNEQIFLNGVFLHDIGEAKVNGRGIGDISAQIKNHDDEKEEYKLARQYIKALNIDDQDKTLLLDGYNRVVKDPGDEKLHFAFKALEKTEYVITAMRVYRNCSRLHEQGKPAMNEDMEKALIGRVLTIDLPKVLDIYIPVFPDSIGSFFKKRASVIDEMFAYSLPWLETHKSWKDKPVDHKKLAEDFKVKWEAFKSRTL